MKGGIIMNNYTVVNGDTLWGIANKKNISLNDLIAANPQISNKNLILPGQIVKIPESASQGSYTVKYGDTLWGIASKNGIKINDLINANPQISNVGFILPGQKINFPSQTSTPTTPSTPSVPETPSTSGDITSLESEVIRLVNVEREKAGRSALRGNSEISRIARLKSDDFIKNNYFSHTSPTYGSPFDMLKSFGINYTAAAENIASGQRTATEVMNSWMNSSGHRANILDSTYNQIGVGVAKDSSGKTYWTQMFIKN